MKNQTPFRRSLCLLVICFFSTFSSFSQGQEVDPKLKFVTIHTPHFDVIINAEQQSLGQYYANQLEKVDNYVSSFITARPQKTIVIINDKWDITNGYATRVPYPHIMVYPVMPGPQDTLADAGNWSLELLGHEYTHILSFEPVPGFMGYLRPIFGSILAPNILLPSWWKEGVAVQVESTISTGGRLRSPYQDALIRALVLGEGLKKNQIADINEMNPSWPEGMRPYLFGSLLWSQMVADKGPTIINQLFQHHGGRVPYFVNAPAEDALGLTYPLEYQKTLNETQRRALAQIAKLKQNPVTADTAIEIKDSELTMSPAISSDGQNLALISRNSIDQRNVRIFIKNPDTNDFVRAKEILRTESESDQEPNSKVYDAPPTGSISRVSWFHLQPQIIYDKIDRVNPIERYSDLYTFNLNSRKTTRLSRSLRAREPSVSPDDLKVAFVKLSPHSTSLAYMDLATKTTKVLVPGELGQRISFPTFRNNHEIIFTSVTDEGSEDLWVYDFATEKTQKLTQSFKKARFPLLTKQGLTFTSAQNGVHNLHAVNPELKKSKALTNTLTSYFSFSEDPTSGDFYATKMTEKGPWVYKIPAAQFQNKNLQLATIEPLWFDRYPPRLSGPTTSEVFTTEDYHVGSSLWPKYWIPFVATTPNGIIFQALTSGFDPLKKHQYAASVAWDSYLGKGSFAGIYQNLVWTVPWFLQSSITNSYFAMADDYQTLTTYSAGTFFPIFSLSPDLSMTLAMKQVTYETPTSTLRGYGPTLGFVYADFTQAGAQISPEKSKSLTLGVSQYLKHGDDLNFTQYTASGSYFLTQFLPKRHVFMTKISGLYTQAKIPSKLGASTSEFPLVQDTVGADFIMRGYLPGHFIGRNMVNTNFEYRFPIRDIYHGFGTKPFYLRRLHGALIVDGVMTEGSAYKYTQRGYIPTSFKEKFWSYGGELRLETTVGYVLPIQFVVYYYVPQNLEYTGTTAGGLTLQITQNF